MTRDEFIALFYSPSPVHSGETAAGVIYNASTATAQGIATTGVLSGNRVYDVTLETVGGFGYRVSVTSSGDRQMWLDDVVTGAREFYTYAESKALFLPYQYTRLIAQLAFHWGCFGLNADGLRVSVARTDHTLTALDLFDQLPKTLETLVQEIKPHAILAAIANKYGKLPE